MRQHDGNWVFEDNQDQAPQLDSPGATLQPVDVLARYSSVVAQVLCRLSWPTGSPMSTDDLRQEGMIALLAAARTYDPSRGASFRTYARTCVENAICSALRAVDPLPQEVRADGRRLREAEMSFAPGTNEPVTRSELATVLGMSLDRVHLVLNALAFSDTMITLDSDEMVWDRTQPSPEDTVVTRDDADRVAEALDSLPRRDRAIVIMRIMEAVPNHTVAQIHGVSPGRVSQVVKESLDHLRTILTEPYLGV